VALPESQSFAMADYLAFGSESAGHAGFSWRLPFRAITALWIAKAQAATKCPGQ
jgi:hypothetical protein